MDKKMVIIESERSDDSESGVIPDQMLKIMVKIKAFC